MKWEPIESAPKNGHGFLACNNDTPPQIIYFSNSKWKCAETYKKLDWKPQFWMPLPKPPSF